MFSYRMASVSTYSFAAIFCHFFHKNKLIQFMASKQKYISELFGIKTVIRYFYLFSHNQNELRIHCTNLNFSDAKNKKLSNYKEDRQR